MRVADFDFSLPKELIAQRPAVPRESARLLCVENDLVNDRHIADPHIDELWQLINAGASQKASDSRHAPIIL